jgi:hypothetical protein
LDVKIIKIKKELDQVVKDYTYHSREIYTVMSTLKSSITIMLRDLLSKFIKINTIFFSKSQSIFSPVGSIDPNAGLIAKDIDDKVHRQSMSKHKAIETAIMVPDQFDFIDI